LLFGSTGYATFPDASTYVLARLEPPGNIPPLTGLSRPTLSPTLRGLELALGHLFKLEAIGQQFRKAVAFIGYSAAET
jgi:hypothetical protein